MRYHGKVRNRNISKHDCEALVKQVRKGSKVDDLCCEANRETNLQVWKAKAASDRGKKRAERESLDSFFYKWLLKKVGQLPVLIAEWSYSVVDALQRYSYDADCELFLKILQKKV